jgi:hypothetical protein
MAPTPSTTPTAPATMNGTTRLRRTTPVAISRRREAAATSPAANASVHTGPPPEPARIPSR